MARKKLSTIQKRISAFYGDITFYRQLISKIISAKNIIRTEKEKKELIECILLKVCAKWESLVDIIIVTAFTKDTTAFAENLNLKLKKKINLQYSEAIVIGAGYLDFRSMSNLLDITDKYLGKTNNIFRKTTKDDRNKIDEVYKIRNYLSHYSKKAKRSLFQMYKDKPYELTYFQEPGVFLLRVGRYQGLNTRRIDIYLNSFGKAVKDLETHL